MFLAAVALAAARLLRMRADAVVASMREIKPGPWSLEARKAKLAVVDRLMWSALGCLAVAFGLVVGLFFCAMFGGVTP